MLQLIECNIDANFGEDDTFRPSIAQLRWGCATDVAAVLPSPATGPQSPDLIIGADVLQRTDDVRLILTTISALDAPVAILSVTSTSNLMEAIKKRAEQL